MVDRADLDEAAALNARCEQYRAALAVKDPRIVAFTIEGESTQNVEDDEGGPVILTDMTRTTVSAEGIQTPPQMLTAIRDQIEARIKEINDQLTGMGVSESSPRQAPQTPVSTSGGAESRPTTQKPVSEPSKPASTAPKPSTSHSRGRR